MNLTLLIVLKLVSQINSKVLIGFEVETPELKVEEQIFQTEPVINRNKWSLFTDMETSKGHMLEAATISGYDKDEIVTVAKEAEQTLTDVAESTNDNSFLSLAKEAFERYTDYDYNSIKELIKCLKPYGLDLCANTASNKYKNHNKCFVTYFGKSNINKQDNTLLKPSKASLKKSKKGSAKKPGNTRLKSSNKKLRQSKKGPANKQVAKQTSADLSCNEIIDQFNTSFAKMKRTGQPVKSAKPKAKGTKSNEIKKEYLGILNTLWHNRNGLKDIDSNFEPKCILRKDKNSDKCSPDTVDAAIQITYQLPISAFAKLVSEYSSKCERLYKDNLKADGIPPNLVNLICILMYNYPVVVDYLDDNKNFRSLWNDKKVDIENKIKNHYSKPENSEKQAKGLFYMFLSYAFMLFNRPNDPVESKKQKKELHYGPKKLLRFMSRVSFSEMYDGMKPGEMDLFKTLLETLCGKMTNGRKDMYGIVKAETYHSLCKNMKLAEYGIIEGYRGLRDQNSDPLTLFKWAQSIINADYRFLNQPKIDLDPTNKSSKGVASVVNKAADKLSPPSGYTFNLDKKYAADDERVTTNNYAKAIYSMGAFTNIERGYTIIEFRAFSKVYTKVNNISKYIKRHPLELFELFENADKEIEKKRDLKSKIDISNRLPDKKVYPATKFGMDFEKELKPVVKADQQAPSYQLQEEFRQVPIRSRLNIPKKEDSNNPIKYPVPWPKEEGMNPIVRETHKGDRNDISKHYSPVKLQPSNERQNRGYDYDSYISSNVNRGGHYRGDPINPPRNKILGDIKDRRTPYNIDSAGIQDRQIYGNPTYDDKFGNDRYEINNRYDRRGYNRPLDPTPQKYRYEGYNRPMYNNPYRRVIAPGSRYNENYRQDRFDSRQDGVNYGYNGLDPYANQNRQSYVSLQNPMRIGYILI